MKRWRLIIGFLFFSMAAWGTEQVFLVAAGVEDAQRAELLKQRLEERIKGAVPETAKVRLRRVSDLWLVELGPLEGDRLRTASLMERLAGEGFDPVLLDGVPAATTPPEAGTGSRGWEWGALLLLGLVGAAFFVRRFRETRRLSGRQEELEASQLRLEREMKEGEQHHEA